MTTATDTLPRLRHRVLGSPPMRVPLLGFALLLLMELSLPGRGRELGFGLLVMAVRRGRTAPPIWKRTAKRE